MLNQVAQDIAVTVSDIIGHGVLVTDDKGHNRMRRSVSIGVCHTPSLEVMKSRSPRDHRSRGIKDVRSKTWLHAADLTG